MACFRRKRAVVFVLPTLLFALLSAIPGRAAESHAAPVTLLANREYATALIKGIRESRQSITACFYLFKTGTGRHNLPRLVVEELVAARRRGVAVTVILENQGKRRHDSLDTDNRATANLLVSGGVKVFFDSPRVTTHTKAVVIDNRHVYLGSHNLTQGALSRNNELSVLIDSPELAAEVQERLKGL